MFQSQKNATNCTNTTNHEMQPCCHHQSGLSLFIISSLFPPNHFPLTWVECSFSSLWFRNGTGMYFSEGVHLIYLYVYAAELRWCAFNLEMHLYSRCTIPQSETNFARIFVENTHLPGSLDTVLYSQGSQFKLSQMKEPDWKLGFSALFLKVYLQFVRVFYLHFVHWWSRGLSLKAGRDNAIV